MSCVVHLSVTDLDVGSAVDDDIIAAAPQVSLEGQILRLSDKFLPN